MSIFTLLAKLVTKIPKFVADFVLKDNDSMSEVKKLTGIDLNGKDDLTETELATLYEHREVLTEMALRRSAMEIEKERLAQEQITKRHSTDMGSDSKLSKNVRPITLLIVDSFLVLILVFLFVVKIPTENSELFKYSMSIFQTVLLAVNGFYFIGRTYEKKSGSSVVSKVKNILSK